MKDTDNPLLQVEKINSLPEFTKMKAVHIQDTLEYAIKKNWQTINELCEKPNVSRSEAILALQQTDNRLSRIWSPVSHINAVKNDDAWRQAYTRCLPLLSHYHTELGQHKPLYQLILSLKEQAHDNKGKTGGSSASGKVSPDARVEVKILDNLLINFKQSGINLSEKKQAELKDQSSQLSKLSSQFNDNVLDATQAWSKEIITQEALEGLPQSALDSLQAAAQQRGQSGWMITLDFPVYNAVMTYANDRDLREEVYTAFVTRASDQQTSKELDNSQIMQQIIALRTQRASLIGLSNYAEQSLVKKMADEPQQVIDFLNELLEKVKPQAKQEMQRLESFSKSELGIDTLQAWDQAYVSEHLRRKTLAYSEEEIKPWFSVDNVLQGLFKLVEKLYNCYIEQKQGVESVDVWHEDVSFYEIYDQERQHIASFYLDLYARPHKRGGAWMNSLCGRFFTRAEDSSESKAGTGEVQIPIAYLTCNASPPAEDKPALFTHSEVITLFHEFGHGLHHMLTQVDYLAVSGINGVEWDAVELPSQFMENWCWQRASLDLFARHYETDELIPEALFTKMVSTRHYNSALGMLRQIEFALFDMRLHMDSRIQTYREISALLAEVRQQTSLLAAPDFNRFQNSFSHIFAGGYAAGYYSYLWAQVLSADVFGKFEETGLFNLDTAQLFLQEILEKGGSRSAKNSFIAFMGREPDTAALLKHSGIH